MHPNQAARAAAFLAALLPLASVHGQGPVGDPTLPPQGLRVAFVDVDQGDCTILIGPTGICMLVDAGRNGDGNARVIPALRRLGVSRVTYAVASHYDADHIGGMDEVIDNFGVSSVWDRGLFRQPTTQSYRDYARSAAPRRGTVAIGATFSLGGGVKVRVLAANGRVLGGQNLPISNAKQFENASSVVLKVEYGDFDMWLGGDVTGGGLQTYDVESRVAKVCGDVDVYHADHHGSNTSTAAATLGFLAPEVCVASAGFKNSYGHPTGTVTNRINNAATSRLFLCTTSGANGLSGFTRTGSIDLVTDGYRYRVTDQMGRGHDVYTDEVAATKVPAGSLRISELHRSPGSGDGVYLEIYCQGPGPVNLRGLQVRGNLGRFTIATPYRLLPGDYFLLSEHGDRSRNGGLPFGHCWPYRAFTPGNLYDTIQLFLNGTPQDTLSYNRNLAGGSRVAAERTILDRSTTAGLFRNATRTFGSGDRGSPGGRNSVDATIYRPIAAMEVLPRVSSGGAAIHMIATAPNHPFTQHAMAMSLGNSPGMRIGSTLIPLNPDVLFDASLLLPGVLGRLPGSGRRGVRIRVPTVPGLQGLGAYFAHVILDPNGPVPFPAASNAARFIFP